MRNLLASEIDVRVGQVGDGWATLLLYKDARVDMTLLDEEYGKLGWKREHHEINGNLYCKISVWDKEYKHWVEREDVGVESHTEKQKGQASDSFKRAGVNFGIGRELYTSPRISINVTTKPDTYNQGKFKLASYDSYTVSSIEYKDDVIVGLAIKNQSGSTVFTYPKQYTPTEPRDRIAESNEAKNELLGTAKEDINKELERQGYITVLSKKKFINKVLNKETIDTMTDAELVGDQLENEA